MQLDLADGWDGVETAALGQVLETLKYNKDPRYALIAAKTANAAARRRGNVNPRVIDNSQTTNNIVVLQLNRNFVTKTTEKTESNTIDITPRGAPGPRQISDLPTPKSVEELLAPVKNQTKDKMLSELEQAFEVAGVFKDENPA